MKKYVKPELFYENYELAQHIAACRWDLKLEDENSCVALLDPNLDNVNEQFPTLFTDTDRCHITSPEEYCSTLGTGGKVLFQS